MRPTKSDFPLRDFLSILGVIIVRKKVVNSEPRGARNWTAKIASSTKTPIRT